MHKRNLSSLSHNGEQEQPAKAPKIEQVEGLLLENAQAKVKQLEQTIELAKLSLQMAIQAFHQVPTEKAFEYLQTIVSVLDGSSAGIWPHEVADACAKQHSAKLRDLYDLSVEKLSAAHCKLYDRRGANADDFAKSASKFVPVTDKLLAYGPEGVEYAFDFMMEVADSVRGELYNAKDSGYGDSEDCYKVMDPELLKVIDLRVAAEAGQPEKETLEWKTIALETLVKERDELGEFGLEDYFPESIRRLQQLTGVEGVEGGRESGSGDDSEEETW